jgi:hypothetical protein
MIHDEPLSDFAFNLNLRRYTRALYVVLLFVVLGIFDQNILEMWFTVSSMFLAFVFMFGRLAATPIFLKQKICREVHF